MNTAGAATLTIASPQTLITGRGPDARTGRANVATSRPTHAQKCVYKFRQSAQPLEVGFLAPLHAQRATDCRSRGDQPRAHASRRFGPDSFEQPIVSARRPGAHRRVVVPPGGCAAPRRAGHGLAGCGVGWAGRVRVPWAPWVPGLPSPGCSLRACAPPGGCGATCHRCTGAAPGGAAASLSVRPTRLRTDCHCALAA